ncbi:MAG: phosphopantetheine-binding protein [Candidatus Sulfotelmatobacter sp.]
MDTEAVVTKIIEDVIGVRGVSRDARFLDIGGNSLHLGAVLTQIHNKTGVAVPVRMLFHKTDSTIAAIAAKIDSQLQESQAALTISQ